MAAEVVSEVTASLTSEEEWDIGIRTIATEMLIRAAVTDSGEATCRIECGGIVMTAWSREPAALHARLDQLGIAAGSLYRLKDALLGGTPQSIFEAVSGITTEALANRSFRSRFEQDLFRVFMWIGRPWLAARAWRFRTDHEDILHECWSKEAEKFDEGRIDAARFAVFARFPYRRLRDVLRPIAKRNQRERPSEGAAERPNGPEPDRDGLTDRIRLDRLRISLEWVRAHDRRAGVRDAAGYILWELDRGRMPDANDYGHSRNIDESTARHRLHDACDAAIRRL